MAPLQILLHAQDKERQVEVELNTMIDCSILDSYVPPIKEWK